MRTDSPKVVLSATLNWTATEVTVVQGEGGEVIVGVMYVPGAELARQVVGTSRPEDSPQEAETWPLQAATAVRKAA